MLRFTACFLFLMMGNVVFGVLMLVGKKRSNLKTCEGYFPCFIFIYRLND